MLLIIGWATAGVVLYALFTFIPRAIQVTIAAACWLIVVIDDFEPRKNKSFASHLCGVTGLLIYVCSVVSTVFAHWTRFCSSPFALAFLATLFRMGDMSDRNPDILASAIPSRIAACLILLGLDCLSVNPSAANP